MKIKLIYLLLNILFLCFNGCKPQEHKDFSQLDHFLLYIQDRDGEGGLLGGDFGDITVYSIEDKKEYYVTRDGYYDRSPSYSKKTNSIIFESKRKNVIPVAGLTNRSDLYSLNLKTKKLQLISDDNFRNQISGYSEIDQPVTSIYGDKIVFLSYGMRSDSLYVYDLIQKDVKLLLDTIRTPLDFFFSKSDTSIIYLSKWKRSPFIHENFIGSVNLKYGENYVLLSEETYRYRLGDVKDNTLLYLKRSETEKYSTLFIYDLKSKKENIIIKLQDKFQEIKSPVFDNIGGIYFIGNKAKEESQFDEDIYHYNMETKQLRQITFSNNIKEGLKFYKR